MGFVLRNPSVEYPRLFHSVHRDTILSRGKRNRRISFRQQRIVSGADSVGDAARRLGCARAPRLAGSL